MVTGAMSKAGASVGGFKRIPEKSQRVDGRDSEPSIRSNGSRYCRCEQTNLVRYRLLRSIAACPDRDRMTRAKRRAWEDSMGDTGTFFWTPGDTPPLWDPFAALSILDVCKKLQVHLSSAQPVAREALLLIFFHETGFSNIKQGMGTGPAVGFGQMEIFNLDKIPF